MKSTVKYSCDNHLFVVNALLSLQFYPIAQIIVFILV